MKERPIIFSGPMVRAILNDQKTQTRRVVKGPGVWVEHDAYGFGECAWPVRVTDEGQKPIDCPYGQPGDLLWVRETWASLWTKYEPDWGQTIEDARGNDEAPKWRPSIHMPKKYARIWLRVTDVRVERVQEISEEDAFAEGIGGGDWLGDPVGEFIILWDSINAKRGYPWESNPWVWVVLFERVKE